MTELHRNLAWNLKRRRAILEISQMELADRADISAGYVGEMEMARKFPQAETLLALARALEVKPYKLIMAPGDLVETAGGDALYEAMGLVKDRVEGAIDEAIREIGRGKGSKGRG